MNRKYPASQMVFQWSGAACCREDKVTMHTSLCESNAYTSIEAWRNGSNMDVWPHGHEERRFWMPRAHALDLVIPTLSQGTP